MRWSIRIMSNEYICITLHKENYTHLFDKDYRLDIYLLINLNYTSIEFNVSQFIEEKELSEIEVVFLLKEYKNQIINYCQKEKNEKYLMFNEVKNELVNYLLDFVNNI